jgi:hypothetical protein
LSWVRKLIVTADDYGYHRRYDEGILRAAEAGAVDAVSAFAYREGLGAEPLRATGVEIGLHLGGERSPAEQADDFEQGFGLPPAYLDGHRHCHALPARTEAVASFAAERGLPVRSVDPAHRELLRSRGVATPDLLVGRLREDEPVLPAELEGDGVELPAVTEWFVHPGLPVGGGFSSYDAGRRQDLNLILRFVPPNGVERARHEVLRLR